jgi:hypothetical protein
MPMIPKHLFAVIECYKHDDRMVFQPEISHWYFDNINDANAMAADLNRTNNVDNFYYIVAILTKGK